jgi:hypothetical protein
MPGPFDHRLVITSAEIDWARSQQVADVGIPVPGAATLLRADVFDAASVQHSL